MLTCKTTLACAFALISSVSAGLIPTIGLPVDPLGQTSVPVVAALISGGGASCPPGFVPTAPGSGFIPTAPGSGFVPTVPGSGALFPDPAALGGIASAASGGLASTTVVNGVVTVIGNTVAVVGSSASDGISILKNSFPGFTNSLVLSCVYGDTTVCPSSNGIEVPVAEAASAPSCSTSPSFTGDHVLIMIGPGADNAQTLHFVQPGEVSSSSSSIISPTTPVAFSSTEIPAVKYLGPISSGFDKYTLFLFKQPAGFKLSDFHDSDRYGFDLTSFAGKYALGAPVAGTYFVSGNKNGGTHSNGTQIGKPHGTNSTNGTLHNSSSHGNGTNHNTNNSTTHSGNFHGNTNSSSSDGSVDPATSSSGGNVPVSPYIATDIQSLSKASAYVANFALAGFIAVISAGLLSL